MDISDTKNSAISAFEDDDICPADEKSHSDDSEEVSKWYEMFKCDVCAFEIKHRNGLKINIIRIHKFKMFPMQFSFSPRRFLEEA